jgi:TonB family protein
MWMLRADLRAIHEYEADGAVLSQGINARQYQYLLITKAASIGGYSIANGISHSTLKKRITMMLHKKSPRSSFLKLLALIPIVGVALALNAETVKDYVYQQPQKKIIKKGKKNATAKMGNNSIEIIPDTASNARIDNPEVGVQKEVKDVFVPVEQNPEFFDVVEQMPEFPGGAHALFEFLGKNIHYPKAAEDAGIQGRVIVTFVVMKDGSIGEVKVAKGVSPELDAEALRCVKSMPKWIPGKQNGEAVNVKYTIPLSFRLPDAKKEETAKE